MRHLLLSLATLLLAAPAFPFCGFYVGRADTKLYNQASQVVLVRDGERTVVTMAPDYKGDLKEFALVVPVPTFLEREQIHVADRAILEHLDAYTAPRLVEYYDEDPCHPVVYEKMVRAQAPTAGAADQERRARSLGVTIEASYSVGEYDILILSAKESSGLATWLEESGYKLPPGAAPVLRSYLDQGMRFFVAKVDLAEQASLGFTYLRPLSVAYETPKFMLPIRLGTVNADGPQELFVYALSRAGRVETTNYRTVKLPSGVEVPEIVQGEFSDFYRDMFARQVEREDRRAVFLEYAWDMGWCDPCAADPLSPEELRELGVFWLDAGDQRGPARNVFVSRLHLRYDRDHFPEDLRFQETGDRTNFQGRYVLRHPWTGRSSCPAATAYRQEVRQREERQAQELANLTGWEITEIRRKMGLASSGPENDPAKAPWWKRLWGG